MKKLISLSMILVLICSLFTGCVQPQDPTTQPSTPSTPTQPSEPGEVKITDGYFFIAISGGYDCFIHFNEDGTYYGSYFGGSASDAGTWELADESVEYKVDVDGNGICDDSDGGKTATAAQVVKMSSYTSGEVVSVPYAEGALHSYYMGTATRTFYHKPDYVYDISKEVPIALYTYYNGNSMGSTFVLNHDKTFNDATGDTFETGTWVKNADGSFALTYDFDGSTGTFIPNEKTATLSKGGSELQLKDTYKEEVVHNVVMNLVNETFSVSGLAAVVTLYGYDDGICELVVDLGQYGSSVVDQGTFEVSAAMRPTFNFGTAGTVEGTPDYATAGEHGITITVHYVGTTTVGAMDLELVGLYNPAGLGDSGEAGPVEAKGTLAKGEGNYTCSISVGGYDLGVDIQIAEFAASGDVVIACGGGTMTCQYTVANGQVTFTGGEDASGYLAQFKDSILGTWNLPVAVESKGTLAKGEGNYTCSISVAGYDLGVDIQIAEFAASGDVVIACGGGTMTCQYTVANGQVTFTGGEDASGYLAQFKDAILGTWNIG